MVYIHMREERKVDEIVNQIAERAADRWPHGSPADDLARLIFELSENYEGLSDVIRRTTGVEVD